MFAIFNREVREGRLRVIREEDRLQRCEGNERRESGYKTSYEMCERENRVFDYFIYLDLVERFKNRSNVMKSKSFGDSTSSIVKDKLKMIRLCCR